MEYITFTKVKLPFGWLGNMSPYPVIYLDKTWRTTEHLFQALRFQTNDNAHQEVIDEINCQKSPMGAKFVAKRNWARRIVLPMSEIDCENMLTCLKLKLEQHPQLIEQLLATKDAVLVEDVTSRPGVNKEYALEQRHTFWGMARRENGEWHGRNKLGEIWMSLRAEQRANLTGVVGNQACL